MTIDWLIVGGGPQGRFIANAIQRAAPAADIAIMDPHASLAAWQRRATACGMTWLRSSGAHHLGQRADSLRVFAARRGYDDRHWLGYYRRPSRALFEAHADHVFIPHPRLTTQACAVERTRNGWRVHGSDGHARRARRVVFALGPGPVFRPEWGSAAEHVYDAGFDLGKPGTAVAVVGGGISGAQLALRFETAGHSVCWVTRTALRLTHFDSDPCYAGPRCLAPFAATPMRQRTALLAAARTPGTLPPDVHARITTARAAGTIIWQHGTVEALADDGLVFDDGARLAADRVVLATGFDPRPTSGGLLNRTIHTLDLSQDRDGHVHLDACLEAAPGLHLAGRPASLQLGPMAGNIRGARLAGQRLAAIARAEDAASGAARVARPASASAAAHP